MENNNLYLALVAAGLFAACTNPALDDRLAEAASAHAQELACQVAEKPTAALPDQSRGLYQQQTHAEGTIDYARGCSGSYAIQVELDVYAQEDQSAVSAQYDPTRDRATLLLRADIEPDASDAELRLCGLELPTRYAYATSSATQLLVPDEVWDRESMPVWRSRVSSSQAQLQLDAFPVLLGVALTEPGASWPDYLQTPELACGEGRSGVSCFPDHDGDGEPGLSLAARRDGAVENAPYPACHTWSYAAPCTSPEPWLSGDSEGAGRMFVGLRTALQLFLDLDGRCTQGSGSVIAEDIQTRTFDCELPDGRRCTPYQATALDARAPSFHVLAKRETPAQGFHDSREFIDEALNRVPSDGGSVSVRRLPAADAPACAAVRAVFDR